MRKKGRVFFPLENNFCMSKMSKLYLKMDFDATTKAFNESLGAERKTRLSFRLIEM